MIMSPGPSLRAQIIAWMLKVSNFSRLVEKLTYKRGSRSHKRFVPHRIKRSYSSRQQKVNEKTVVTFELKESKSRIHVIFFHGGAYVFGASSFHWKLAEQLVKKSLCRMTLLDYPLAPEHSYKTTFSMIDQAYASLISQYAGDQFVFMGDSAGGGLALAFTQKLLKENQQKLPAKLVLLSPWLDLSMSNPEISKQVHSDHVLTVQMLRNAGMKYANGDDRHQYLLSPINGNLRDIPKSIVFFGTEELFYADCMRFKSMVDVNAQDIAFKEYQKMQHDWALMPIPERKQVINEICRFLDE